MLPIQNNYLDRNGFNGRGLLYLGNETLKERGFTIGLFVNVGAAYEEPIGKIIGLSDETPYRAKVKFSHADGRITSCWIQSRFLSLKENLPTR